VLTVVFIRRSLLLLVIVGLSSSSSTLSFPLLLPMIASSSAIFSSSSSHSIQPQTSSSMSSAANHDHGNNPTFIISKDSTAAMTTAKMLQSKTITPPDITTKRRLVLPVVYTIAGSDSGGGAGLQTDLHTIRAFGGHGCCAITCLTAQNSLGVTAIHAPPIAFFQQQWQALVSDIAPDAVKIGMLGTKELAEAVGSALSRLLLDSTTDSVPIVLDPVMISTSGSRLLDADAEAALKAHVFPFVDIITPNKYEAEALLGRKLITKQDVEEGARELLAMMKTVGASVLIKGGHANETNSVAQDYLLSSPRYDDDTTALPRLCDSSQSNDMRGGIWLRSPRYDTIHTHGTGCTLSSAIAAALANGRNVVDACCLAKAYVSAGIQAAIPVGQGPGPVAHGQTIQSEHFPIIPLNGDCGDDDMEEASFRSITDLGKILPVVDSLDWIQRLCDASTSNERAEIRDVQLRIKGVADSTVIDDIVRQSQEACTKANIRLWVNDYWRAAIKAGCFGVHLGQEDLYQCVAEGGLAAMRNANMALGLSTHSYGELAAALGVRPSYISLGPVFATTSKSTS
jgi:hydroxymethylpyrimidine kinase / phosphomethylpyrimidine kinase / thiamine-phosphate diphosphorylase